MRNLFAFIWKYKNFFLFLIIESLSVFLLIRNNNYQRAGFINSSSEVAGNILQTYDNFTQYFTLKQENERLSAEIADLHNKLVSSLADYTTHHVVINDTAFRQKYTYISAKVVNNSTNRQNNYLTLNRGSSQGVKPEMAVISGSGVVGIVKDVSANFCSVISVLNRNTSVPATIKKYGENAILKWPGEDYQFGLLANIPSHLKLVKGDTVVTSSYSSIFPQGVMVGKVEQVVPVQGNTFNDVKIRFSTDFRKLVYVSIVNNLFKAEQDSIERVIKEREEHNQ
jgi:rod shape-determining protein MreC